jgi:hypothetical protein
VASAAAPSVRAAPHGAVSVSGMVPANTNVSLTLSFGWNFPHRDMYNYGADPEGKAFIPFGNMYAKHYTDSVDSAVKDFSTKVVLLLFKTTTKFCL